MRIASGLIMALILALMACDSAQSRSGDAAELRFFSALSYDTVGTLAARAVELGTPQSDQLARELAGAGQEVHEALTYQPEPGQRGFAFVLSGCAETGAELTVTDTEITAKLTGNEDVDCVMAVDFLAVFTIGAAAVPSGAQLAR